MFNLKQGWEPLCKFLGCEIPREDFPWVNAGQSLLLAQLAKRRQKFAIKFLFISLFVILLAVCYNIYF